MSQEITPSISTHNTSEANVCVNKDINLNRTCYYYQFIDIPAYLCAGTCGILFYAFCVPNTVLHNEWCCNKFQYEIDMYNGHPLWVSANIRVKMNRVGVKAIIVGVRAQKNRIKAKGYKVKRLSSSQR